MHALPHFRACGLPYLHTPCVQGDVGALAICAPLQLPMYTLVRKCPTSSCADKAELWVPAGFSPHCHPTSCRAGSVWQGCCSCWLRQRRDAGGATSGSIKPGFNSKLFPLIGLCLLLRISIFYTFFPHAISFFASNSFRSALISV